MCDLIDLNSPDAKGSRNPTKLASPLIPAPKNAESNSETNSLMITEKRENEGNNPFDTVLHETAEYVSKKGDPFEVMLQRALKFKRKRATDLKVRSVNFADDFTPKSKKRYLKMRNKTLDGSLLETKLYSDISSNDQKVKIKIETVDFDAENAGVCDNNATENTSMVKQCQKTLITGPELELSILNQSAMNDTLLESVSKSIKDDDIADTLFKEFGLSSNNLKLRSLSQGAGRSPTILSCLNKRSLSVTDDQKKCSQSDSSALSLLDKAFLQSKQDEQSIFSSLSNVSSITKLSSISISSIDTMNHAFLDSNSLKLSQEKINTTENSMEIKSKYDLSDLAERLDKLRCTMNEAICTSNITETESNFMKEEKKQISNDKLIDVDVFLPEQNSSKECNKSSTSTVSSDSVFAGTNKVDKSILNEAKMLSKTFEELALRTDSESNTDDDLISNNTLWMSELLPAFEDDLVVENLIELPISPEENSKDIRNNNKEQSPPSDNIDRNSLKEMEPQFTDCVKQTIITSLLSDLRKLVKVESNPEINKLLDNLENVLDSNCKNNTELLVTCLNISNELRSPQKILSKSSDIIERSEDTSTDKSEEESEKISSKEEISNAEKLSSDINRLEDTLQTTTSSSGSLSVNPSSFKDNSENYHSREEEHTNCTKENDKDEKLAVELLMNLGKLLSGQEEDATTMQLLKSIGKALNVASNNHKSENEIQLDNNKRRSIQRAIPIKASESDCNVHSTKAKHRQSIETKPKPLEKTVRRSLSVIHSSPKNTSNMQIRKYRSTSEVEDGKKHFLSKPRLIDNLANKKAIISETCNIGKADVIQSESKKEKCIAINDVKNKLKKRTSIVNKRGPMKAVHPVDNMQKKGTFSGKQTASSSQTTPPKSDKTTCGKIISSTPNSVDNKHVVKKSVRSKPMASSTPDSQNMTAYVNMSGSNERKESPKKLSKLPTPKKCTTPKTDAFRNSKFSTSPKHSLSFNVNYQRSPQRLNRSLVDRPRYSPVYQKKSAEKIQQSPFKENRITGKVKPLNLISKLKQHGPDDVINKENNYA
ncbi:uncharacterized protein LOC114937818 isoform X2 [Nylanderia fulva]|uniref:uncharacterized protein LOC114937818 isoform X2 n=1 Tax=Nylanderia fulva TaxID=613905 RepID=UPI0010FB26B8|nr:uncharacterized protein LOC114937818 isoform X2 [Nylanderia fulva]